LYGSKKKRRTAPPNNWSQILQDQNGNVVKAQAGGVSVTVSTGSAYLSADSVFAFNQQAYTALEQFKQKLILKLLACRVVERRRTRMFSN